MTNQLSPVVLAVEPLRAAAVERARTEGRQIAEVYIAKFNADPSLAAYPRRTGMMSKIEYELRMRDYRIIGFLTTAPNPHISSVRVIDPKKIEEFVDDCGKRAEAEYTAFVLKLEKKIGQCDDAKLEGDHVWGYSVLRVTKGSTVESWKTRQIVNVSKLGRFFNQWPTRKVKR